MTFWKQNYWVYNLAMRPGLGTSTLAVIAMSRHFKLKKTLKRILLVVQLSPALNYHAYKPFKGQGNIRMNILDLQQQTNTCMLLWHKLHINNTVPRPKQTKFVCFRSIWGFRENLLGQYFLFDISKLGLQLVKRDKLHWPWSKELTKLPQIVS